MIALESLLYKFFPLKRQQNYRSGRIKIWFMFRSHVFITLHFNASKSIFLYQANIIVSELLD